MRETDGPELHVFFHDHLIPHAGAGVYTVVATHELYDENGDRLDTAPPLPVSEQAFEVRPARFVLDDGSVHAYYPPEGSSGSYDNVLPHITLTRAVLPWDRELTPNSRSRAHAPWIALLVFRQGELPDDPGALGENVTRTVGELRVTAGSGVIGPALRWPLPADVEASKCRTIDVPAEVFRAVAPWQDEMYYLAHVRDVKPPESRAGEEKIAEGRYAVVTANRFPRVPGRYVAHLVSLEGYEPHLTPDPPAGHETVRLVSLHAWSFQHDPFGVLDTGALLKKLVDPGHQDPEGDEQLALRLPVPPPGQGEDAATAYARRRLALGHVPVAYRTLSGELTYAWYRGPAAPVTAPEVPGQAFEQGHTTSDHALVYEREHGLFDVSYAAAWTLGRTAALADPSFASEMTRARRELANQAVVIRATAGDPARSRSGTGPGASGVRGLGGLLELAEPADGRSLAEAFAAPPDDEATEEPFPAETPRPRRDRAAGEAALVSARAVELLSATAAGSARSLAEWLDRLALLHGIPFHHLVPDERMLPAESLRMFRIDRAWLKAVVAGASDLGLHTTTDLDVDRHLRAAVASRRTPGREPEAGLLIRSALVRAWPEFPLAAYLNGEKVKILRQDRLAEDTLIALFDTVPDRVDILEPGQGIHFGIDEGDVVSLRSIGGADAPPLGAPLEAYFPDPEDPDAGTVFTRYLRSRPIGETPDVLRLRGDDGLVPELAGAFGREGDERDLTPAEFAVNLVNAPQLQRLTPGGAPYVPSGSGTASAAPVPATDRSPV
ncbi:hypothetical protein OHB36_28545 [Streptomyces sp. NBC_00320]|uniref:hypothetical protein n=1 Tax=Streptomyces sp. NBC_00320 TaxID=2975711 RepID=UPI0022538FB3|nr:hypothetical protein [Streptomyces sp. NBC_00320]MCX5150666.1 hypothetical protein [Streptomyces sp. NBC_00320]